MTDIAVGRGREREKEEKGKRKRKGKGREGFDTAYSILRPLFSL
jgi:hypothetical protein